MRLADYISKYAELRTLYGLAQQDFLSRRLIHHNWKHVLRDLARAIIIGEAENANLKIVLASVILHDIGRLYPEEGQDHYTVGAKTAPDFLKRSEFTETEIDEIVHCIRCHGQRGLEEPQTLEAKVCYDVDVLSCSVGYVGVARVFDFFMREEGLGVKGMMAIPSGMKGPRKDFYTKTGKSLGEKGLEKAREFWRELGQELMEEERAVKKTVLEYEGD